jgi:hypothetical protein
VGHRRTAAGGPAAAWLTVRLLTAPASSAESGGHHSTVTDSHPSLRLFAYQVSETAEGGCRGTSSRSAAKWSVSGSRSPIETMDPLAGAGESGRSRSQVGQQFADVVAQVAVRHLLCELQTQVVLCHLACRNVRGDDQRCDRIMADQPNTDRCLARDVQIARLVLFQATGTYPDPRWHPRRGEAPVTAMRWWPYLIRSTDIRNASR